MGRTEIQDAAAAYLARAVDDGLIPAAVIEVGSAAGPVAQAAAGTRVDAIFDLASLTKVLATGIAAAHLVGTRRLDLDTPVTALVPEWRGADRARVTVRDLLAHQSGLPAHLPLFAHHTGADAVVGASADAPLEAPPRARAIYSDLGFIVLGRAIEQAGRASLEALVAPLLEATSDDPPRFSGTWPARVVLPTGHSTSRGRDLQGDVHDENAAAMGGIAGHAGLFGSASGVGGVARLILRGLDGAATPLAPATVLRAFTRRSPVPGSSRALAWDTALPTSSCGATMSPTAIGHTGYTGTSLWVDPALDLYVVLLTNRLAGRATTADIARIRRDVHDLVGRAWREWHRAQP